MAQKIIPDLTETLTTTQNAWFVVDSGIQTFKIKAINAATVFRDFFAPTFGAIKVAAFTIDSTYAESVVRLDSSAGAFSIQLPDPATLTNKKIVLKDVGGVLSSKPITLVRDDVGDLIEGLASSFILESDFGSWTLFCDGTNFHFI